MIARIIKNLYLCLLVTYMTGCQPKHPHGSLLIGAPSNGSYDIYRVASEQPFQFISEQVGYFNQTIRLPIGSYLILADCSYEKILIQPNQQVKLKAYALEFTPPVEPQKDDLFSIQCDRFARTRMRQSIENRYQLNILEGTREILVGMVPMTINTSEIESSAIQSETKQYKLAAVELTASMQPDKGAYFVSPKNGLLSVTSNQSFGKKQFLLPGSYTVEVNGTRSDIDLKEGEVKTIEAAFIKVSISEEVELERSPNIVGTPLYVELNDKHWLDLNQTYPVLPGEASIKLNGSNRSYQVELVEREINEIQARAVLVEFDCSPWDWNCLGGRKIYLYNKDDAYPFAEGYSDVPLLFLEKDAWLSIQGSRDIRYELSDKEYSKLASGFVKFIPKPSFRTNQITDLSRVEAIQKPYSGFTLDLPLEEESQIPLIAGNYYFAQYTSLYGAEYERRQTQRWFRVKPFETTTIEFNAYLSDKRFQEAKKEEQQRKQHFESNKQKQLAKTFQPIIQSSSF